MYCINACPSVSNAVLNTNLIFKDVLPAHKSGFSVVLCRNTCLEEQPRTDIGFDKNNNYAWQFHTRQYGNVHDGDTWEQRCTCPKYRWNAGHSPARKATKCQSTVRKVPFSSPASDSRSQPTLPDHLPLVAVSFKQLITEELPFLT